VNNLSQILYVKNQCNDIKMTKGYTSEAYFMRISKIKDQLSFDKELGGISPTWETFITTINNNDKFPTFDLLGKCSQEETQMISRGRIPKHDEGQPTAFSIQGNKLLMVLEIREPRGVSPM